jgi:hypothetical protein
VRLSNRDPILHSAFAFNVAEAPISLSHCYERSKLMLEYREPMLEHPELTVERLEFAHERPKLAVELLKLAAELPKLKI